MANLFKYHLDDEALYKSNSRASSFPSERDYCMMGVWDEKGTFQRV